MANRHQDLVGRRAKFRCEYCRLPARFSQLQFVCDHIIARKHGGLDQPENLAYACAHCNSRKLDNIAGLDIPEKDPVRLFNPRRDVWSEHFKWQDGFLIGRTPIGRATVKVLAINSTDRLRLRRTLIAEGVEF